MSLFPICRWHSAARAKVSEGAKRAYPPHIDIASTDGRKPFATHRKHLPGGPVGGASGTPAPPGRLGKRHGGPPTFKKLPHLKNESWSKPALFSTPKTVMKKGRLVRLRCACMHEELKLKRKGSTPDCTAPSKHHLQSHIQLQRPQVLGMDAVLCFARALAKTTATAHARARRSLCGFFIFFQKIACLFLCLLFFVSKPRGLLHFLLFWKMRHAYFFPPAGVFRKMDFRPKSDRGRDPVALPPGGLAAWRLCAKSSILPRPLLSSKCRRSRRCATLPLKAHHDARVHACIGV